MRPLRPVLLALALATLLATCALPLAAQTVHGTLDVRGSTRAPRGALVLLLDDRSRPAASVPADSAGRFRLVAPGPGRYQLRVERVGFPTVNTAPFTLAVGETREHPVVLPAEAFTLEGLQVSARSRCQVGTGGRELHRVWEEARKALTLTARTAADSAVEFQYSLFERELDRRGRPVRDSSSREWRRGRPPFASIPVDSLDRGGFVQVDSSGLTFFGPDAEVLLSDVFLNGHCFRLVEGSGTTRGMVGLAFAPLPRQKRQDVEGVFWLERRSAELKHLEFNYTGVRAAPELTRGRVEFMRLPAGGWAVSRWVLRWPLSRGLVRFAGDGSLGFDGLSGVREVGGSVVSVRTVPRADGGPGRLSGGTTAYDAPPLPSARLASRSSTSSSWSTSSTSSASAAASIPAP